MKLQRRVRMKVQCPILVLLNSMKSIASSEVWKSISSKQRVIPSEVYPHQQGSLRQQKFVSTLPVHLHNSLGVKMPASLLPKTTFQKLWTKIGHSMAVLYQVCTPMPVPRKRQSNLKLGSRNACGELWP